MEPSCISYGDRAVEDLTKAGFTPQSLSVSEQVDQFVGGQGVGGVGAFEERIGQVALGVVELDDLLLDCVGGEATLLLSPSQAGKLLA
jgi:hypothetical protein